uniref:Uncharacterized protein n=1 Tax=Arundo donax TaxID=35708 RepID=A0A0A9FGN9_ARUDO
MAKLNKVLIAQLNKHFSTCSAELLERALFPCSTHMHPLYCSEGQCS